MQYRNHQVIRSRGLTGFATSVVLIGAGLGTVTSASADEPKAPPELSSVSIPLPHSSHLSQFIKNQGNAVKLGKALFWDMAAGSDGQACASCHFHAGADNRVKNQLSPGLNRVNPYNTSISQPDETFQPTASGGRGGPNYTLKNSDFPFHQFNHPDSKHSGVKFSSNDISSSQGTFGGAFTGMPISPDQSDDVCDRDADPIFHVGSTGVRKVEPRNAPSTYNAVFNFRNFWDGRANNVFNGLDGFGKRSPGAKAFLGDGRAVRIDLRNASLGSQAVDTILSSFEMSCEDRSVAQLGQKLIPRKALAAQKVHANDSELRYLRADNGIGLDRTYGELIQSAFRNDWWEGTADIDGFSQMEANFPLFWGMAIKLYEATLISDQSPYDSFAAYKSEPFDPSEGNEHALSESQLRGLDVFLNEGKCINCHKGSEFSAAASNLQHESKEGGLVERMHMGDSLESTALYDQGFYNIGVTPTHEDLGVGGTDKFGNPLSFTEQYVSGKFVDPFKVDPCSFEVKFEGDTCLTAVIYDDSYHRGNAQELAPGRYNTADLLIGNDRLRSFTLPDDWSIQLFEHSDFSGYSQTKTRSDSYTRTLKDKISSLIVTDEHGCSDFSCSSGYYRRDLSREQRAVNGSFKVPILRNVELTGPYMHNGSMATLEQVVEFYNRGGNFSNRELAASDIQSLGLSSQQKSDLVSFLKSLTDPRVANASAPFDHPQLFVPNGHSGDELAITELSSLSTSLAADELMEIPAIGREGRLAEGLPLLKPFLHVEISPFNIARGKFASQSGTTYDAFASRAVDGNTASRWSGDSVTRSERVDQAWWQVDLGRSTTIGKINVFNRTGSNSDRLTDFYVFVSDRDFSGRSFSDILYDTSVWRTHVRDQSPDVLELSPFAQGRYVRVQLAGRDYMNLAEVQVFEVADPDAFSISNSQTTSNDSGFGFDDFSSSDGAISPFEPSSSSSSISPFEPAPVSPEPTSTTTTSSNGGLFGGGLFGGSSLLGF